MNKNLTGASAFPVVRQFGPLAVVRASVGFSDRFALNDGGAPLGPDHRRGTWEAAAARRTPPVRPYRDFAKRLIDIIFVVLSLPFSLPVVLMCAFALQLEGGNPFYTQRRLGRGGKQFSILKLRTMVRDADAQLESHLRNNPAARAEWDTLQKLMDDPRITPIGRALRATSLDELPQLYNVLVGDMSIVGPRPMLPEQLPLYGDARAYNALRPGITGLWQVSARNDARFSYRKDIDGLYERDLSLPLDFKILFRTVGVVLRRTGH